VGNAAGAILAHSHKGKACTLRKGHKLAESDCIALKADGVLSVIVARLEHGDVSENDAAHRLAQCLAGSNIRVETAFTGRVNLYSQKVGLFEASSELITRINRIDPAITIATLPDNSFVEAGRIIATVKIIPFAVSGKALSNAVELAGAGVLMKVSPAVPKRVGLVSTKLPGLKITTMDKTLKILKKRLEPSGGVVTQEIRVAHTVPAVSAALLELVAQVDILIVFGASAITDPEDVIPAALHDSRGTVERLGMPVDPGNLLLIGELNSKPVIGAPGCARSPAENGFDWVLQRLVCDAPVTNDFISGLGVGGLLMEISSRAQPREG